jgi:uncharacterized Zn-finger protein
MRTANRYAPLARLPSCGGRYLPEKRLVRTVTASTPFVEPPEVIKVHSHRVSCDGVGGALGHPRVYMEMGAEGWVECPYCDRKFVLAHGSEGHEDEEAAPGVYEGAAGH